MIEIIKQIGELNRFFLVSLALTIAWLLNEAGHLDKIASFIGAWLPYLITQCFAAYRRDLSDSIRKIAAYIAQLEREFGRADLGWESHFSQTDSKMGSTFLRTKVIHRLAAIFCLLFSFYYASIYSLGFHFF